MQQTYSQQIDSIMLQLLLDQEFEENASIHHAFNALAVALDEELCS
jgi:hypothetical protein